MFLVAAVYPTFTYGDDPARWVANEAGGKQLRESTDAHRKVLWKMVEADVGNGPHWLGKNFSALDVYVAVMGRWRPRVEWVIETFGEDRCMFESNFPVDRSSCTYVALWNAFKRITDGYSPEAQRALFAGTAQRIYRLPPVAT